MTNAQDPMHRMTEQELAEALRSHGWRPHRPATPCLDEAEIAAFVDGGLAERARERVAGHLADCETCVGIAATLLRLREAETIDVPPDLRRRARQLILPKRGIRWKTRWKVAASAAGLLLALGTWIWHQGGPQPSEPEPNSLRTYTGGVERHRILAPSEGAAVDPRGFDLRWTEVPEGLFYEVQILSEDGDLVWQGRTEAVEMRLSADAGLDPDRGYFLWVRVYLPDGTTMKSSVVGFHVNGGEPDDASEEVR